MNLLRKIHLVFGVIITVLMSNSYAFADSGDRVIGMWQTASKNARIRIYKANDAYYGKIVWASDLYEADGETLKKDSKNEDPSKRSRTIKDLILLNSFKYEDDVWTGGTIYDPQNGKTYKCKMELKSADLHIRGYIGISMFGRTEIWKRVAN